MALGYEFSADRHGEVSATRVPQPWRIVHIDALLDGISREMRCREGSRLNPYSATSWDRAWKRNPDLRVREDALMRERGKEQQYRDRMAWKACQAEQRRRRIEQQRESRRQYEASKCPTCGHHTLSVAA